MSKIIQAIRGMHDLLPNQTPRWQWVEGVLRQLLATYGYAEIRFPIVEKTALFSRSIGEVTDIVEKEMYTFEDRNGDSLSLRPEGTAGCVRAGIENSLFHNQVQRLWYTGPMFRHERPQKGRYRQFHQVGVEAFGLAGPDIDVEQILLSARLWEQLNVAAEVRLEINTLGEADERAAYREQLVDYLQANLIQLDEESQRRLTTNPLRILDSKNPAMAELLAAAPSLWDCLGADSRHHFEAVTALLDAAEIKYRINPRLVRGLDYYSKTVFEWVTDSLGAQGTVCAGGRYDILVEQLGGRPTAAVGFALGLERLLSLVGDSYDDSLAAPHAYLVISGEAAQSAGLLVAERLRRALPNLRLICHCGGGGLKGQFKRADKSGARWALILGDEELAAQRVGVKPLRGEGAQSALREAELVDFFQQQLADNL